MPEQQVKGADVFELLKNDHREVGRIIGEIKKVGGNGKGDLISLLYDTLSDHMKLEENFVYPVLEDMEELTDAIQESLSEHNEMEDLLQDVLELDAESDEWQTIFLGLEDAKETHIRAEEQEIFPRAKKLMSREELARLTDEVMTERGLMSLKAPPRLAEEEERRPEY